MFEGWQPFYQTTGSAAGALIGLLFIVATLSTRNDRGVTIGVKLFMTPIVFHLGLVLSVSALALAPLPSRPVAIAIAACALIAAVDAAWVTVRIARLANQSHWSDVWCYGFAPLVADLILLGAASAAAAGARAAIWGLPVSLLVLLLLAIRNAWDLVTWLAPRRPQ